MHRSLLHVLAVCAGSLLAAQAPLAPDSPALPPVPIHGKPDDPAYGLWAMGDGYKASFHDGFVFWPRLGTGYDENLPLRWTTESVHVGTTPIDAGPAAVQVQPSAWRYEYRGAAVTERYDVRREGVEQSFVVHERPAAAGDLVIRGRFLTRLATPERAALHAPLVLRGPAGEALVGYGSAIAFDASGSSTPVTTACTGGTVVLTVPAAWLAGARFPVTVDPLISMTVRSMTGAVQNVDVAQDGISTNSLMVTVVYASSATDHDVVAYLADADMNPATPVFTDIHAASTDSASAAYVGGEQRWTIVYRKWDHAYAYRQVRNDLTLNGGGTATIIGVGQPRVGGTRDGHVAAIVLQRAASQVEQVGVYFWHPATKQVEQSVVPHAPVTGTGIDRIRPAVNQIAKDEAWLVVWEELDRINLTSSIRGNIVRRDGSVGTVRDLTWSFAGAPAHRMRPTVAGMDGRYLVAYLAGPTADQDWALQVHTRRVAWGDASNTGTPGTGRVFFNGSAGISGLDLAHDDETRSHWGLAYTSSGLLGTNVRLARLGWSGGSVEQISMTTSPQTLQQWSPAVTFDRGSDAFAVGFAAEGSTNPVWLGRLGYASGATTFPYGTGCGGSVSSSPAPRAGNEFFRLLLGGATGSPGAALLLAGAQASLPLDAFGMPGCRLYVQPDGMVSIPAAVSGGGSIVDLPLPDAPVFVGDLYCQWLVVTPGANALGLKTTQGLLVHVR